MSTLKIHICTYSLSDISLKLCYRNVNTNFDIGFMIHSTYTYTYISQSRHFVLVFHLTVHLDFSEKYKTLK